MVLFVLEQAGSGKQEAEAEHELPGAEERSVGESVNAAEEEKFEALGAETSDEEVEDSPEAGDSPDEGDSPKDGIVQDEI